MVCGVLGLVVMMYGGLDGGEVIVEVEILKELNLNVFEKNDGIVFVLLFESLVVIFMVLNGVWLVVKILVFLFYWLKIMLLFGIILLNLVGFILCFV